MRTLVFVVGLALAFSGCRPQSGGRSAVMTPVSGDAAAPASEAKAPEQEQAWQTDGLLPQFAEGAAPLADALPAGLEVEPEPEAKVVYVKGMPKISLNGTIVDPVFNQSDVETRFRLNAAAKASSLGITINQLTFRSSLFEKAPGVYDFKVFDEHVRQMLAAVPDARIVMLLRMDLPKWTKAHPEGQIGYAKGAQVERGDECTDRLARPSAASPEFRAEVNGCLKQLFAYIRAQPWGKRVIGIRPAWGIYTEWHCYGMYQGPDVGPAMTAAFRRWKDGKYANEDAPTMEESVSDDIYYLDAEKHEKAIDFYECQANVIADFMLEVAHTVKTELPGRLVGMYYGYVLASHPPEGANVMLDKVLASPDIDFLSDPAMYMPEVRLAGGAYYHRTIPATFHRYGKIAMLEDDMRHYHVREHVSHKKICSRDPREAEMVTRRNWLNQYFDGCGIQSLDPEWDVMQRPFTMDTPPVWRAVHDTKGLLAKYGERPADSGNDTAVVVDWRERFRRSPKDDGHFTDLYVYSIVGMYASGVPVDLMTLDDFLAQPEGRYRKAVFLNVLSPDPERRWKLEKRVGAEGFKSVWMIRCPFDLPSAQVRAKAPQSGEAWREMLTGLGAHAVGPAGHYVRRHGDKVMFHTGKAGRWELDLPGYDGATELFSGRRYEGSRFTVETDGPDTLWFRFDRASGK